MERSKKVFVHNLVPNRPKCAELVLLGDLHIGYPTVEIDRLIEDIEIIKNRGCYVILMGDLIEAGIRTSIGDSLFYQELSPQEQMDRVFDIIAPLEKKLLGIVQGNHEKRIYKETGVDISKILAEQYFRYKKVHYFGYSSYHIFRVGKQTYTAYITHGSTGSRLPYTKMKAILDYGKHLDVDIIASGHTHELNSYTATKKKIDLRRKKIVSKKTYYVLTGSYLGYEDSYAEQKGMMPSKIGYAKLKLYKDDWDIFVSI